jgi:hypothetical protein
MVGRHADVVLDGLPGRVRIAKLIRTLGGSSTGERANAIAAVDKALRSAALSWDWLSDLVSRGELPGGVREAVFKRLVVARLQDALVVPWARRGGEDDFVRDVLVRCESGSAELSAEEIDRALTIAADARRRAGK